MYSECKNNLLCSPRKLKGAQERNGAAASSAESDGQEASSLMSRAGFLRPGKGHVARLAAAGGLHQRSTQKRRGL